MQPVPCCGPTNIRHCRTKCSCRGELPARALRVCVQKLAGSGMPPTTFTPPFLGLMVSSIMTHGVVSGELERLAQKIHRKCHATE
jgi:hypothetical protein